MPWGCSCVTEKLYIVELELKDAGIVLSGGNVDISVMWESWKSSSQHKR